MVQVQVGFLDIFKSAWEKSSNCSAIHYFLTTDIRKSAVYFTFPITSKDFQIGQMQKLNTFITVIDKSDFISTIKVLWATGIVS